METKSQLSTIANSEREREREREREVLDFEHFYIIKICLDSRDLWLSLLVWENMNLNVENLHP
jgi:hypothetical protein